MNDPNSYTALLAISPADVDGHWNGVPATIELLVGEVLTLFPPNTALADAPTFTVASAPPTSEATFTGGSITIDVPGSYAFLATWPNGRTARVSAIAVPANTLATHNGFLYFLRGQYAVRFVRDLYGHQVAAENTVTRPASARRKMLRSMAQDPGTAALLIERANANAAISANELFDGVFFQAFETTTPDQY